MRHKMMGHGFGALGGRAHVRELVVGVIFFRFFLSSGRLGKGNRSCKSIKKRMSGKCSSSFLPFFRLIIQLAE